MTIAAYIGAPGECKTYSLTYWTVDQMKRKRTCFSQYSIMGAGRLYKLSDLEHPICRGSAVAIDEVARIFPAREWNNEDAVEAHVLEIHRHYGQDIRFAAQSPMQVAVSLRRLVEKWIFTYRVGWADPSQLIASGIRPQWWQLPIAVRQVEYYGEDIGADGKPVSKPSQPPSIRYRWFKRSVAGLYDTTQRVMPASLKLDIEERMEGAETRLAERWIVKEGKCLNGDDVNLERGRDEKKQKAARGITGSPLVGQEFDGGEEEGPEVAIIVPKDPSPLPGGGHVSLEKEVSAIVQAWEDEPAGGSKRKIRIYPA